MATVLRFQDFAPSLTPPPSDRGDCEDTTMLNSDTYLPEVYYPSPAPSFSHQHHALTPQSPDMGVSDSTYDTEEENQQQLFFSTPEGQIYDQTTTYHTAGLYASTMPFQPFEQSWVPFNNYPSSVAMFPYSNSSDVYYFPQASSSIVPPAPQGVTAAAPTFSFNDPITRDTGSSTRYSESYSNHRARHQSPTDPSIESHSEVSSRSCSPNPHQSLSQSISSRRASIQKPSNSSLHSYGIPIRSPDSTTVQAWRCAYPNCTSRAVFTRGCDLRKHYNRHSKHLFCRVAGCPQSEAACVAAAQQQAIQAGAEALDPSQLALSGGFSSKKDRARHEAKHNPGIKCEWKGVNGEECGRVFSRMDNMKDHVRRIHNKGQSAAQTRRTS